MYRCLPSRAQLRSLAVLCFCSPVGSNKFHSRPNRSGINVTKEKNFTCKYCFLRKLREKFLVDTDGRIAAWYAGAERIYGYQSDEVIGQDASIFYPDEYAAVFSLCGDT
jgi:hypothetical protein